MEKQQTKGNLPQQSAEFLKKRKFMLVLPLLVIPFLTMAFKALGGGDEPKTGRNEAAKGINLTLPTAQFKDSKSRDKLSIYQDAGKDTDSRNPGLNKDFLQSMSFPGDRPARRDSSATNGSKNSMIPEADRQSARLQAKLTALNRQLNQAELKTNDDNGTDQDQDSREQVKKLKTMMKAMSSRPPEDPEMKQLNDMLTKIQAIQNPSMVKAPEEKPRDLSSFKAIPAVVDGRQKVADGGAVRLRLTDSVTIKDQVLPKGQLLFGSCQITNQRLLLSIKNVRLEKEIIPVDLTVFSLDGMQGIPAPEAEIGNAAGSGADNALQSMEFIGMDQSLSTQAAAGGINAAKTLFSKKIRKIKVSLKNDFPVLLKNNELKK